MQFYGNANALEPAEGSDDTVVDRELISRTVKMRLSELLTMSITFDAVRDLCSALTDDICMICDSSVEAWCAEWLRENHR